MKKKILDRKTESLRQSCKELLKKEGLELPKDLQKKSLILEYLNSMCQLFSEESEQGRSVRAYYRWVLKTGKLFTEKGDAKKFHKTFKKRFKGCYYNAQFMAMDNGIKYYEGWGTTEKVGIPLEHAFNVVDGKVIDISWPDGVEYFGIEVPVEFAREEMLKEKTAHPILYQWWEKIKKEKE